MKIQDVIRTKGSTEVVTIAPDASVADLVALLSERNIGAVVVSVDGVHIQGIVSERDIVRRLHSDEATLEAPVSAIMTATVRTCEPDQGLEDLMVLMTEHRVRHVPVVRDGRLTGVVSIGDIVKNRMAELEFERDQLDSYVHQS